MFAISEWIKRRCEARRRTKVADAHEAEWHVQQEQILLELQCTIDPLVATQTYTNRFCPLLSRLPEELLLCILNFLREDDGVTLHCLQIVSRAFLCILHYESAIWNDTWYCETFKRTTIGLHHACKLQFRRLLQRDGRCKNCKDWNETREDKILDDCKFHRALYPLVYSSYHRKPYCYACESSHAACQFSHIYQETYRNQPERRCLGQQGSVQLCEHVQIAWASIKTHIDDWRQENSGRDWQACLQSFNIECHDISHDTRCTDIETPTCPRALLKSRISHSDIVVLHLEWSLHGPTDTINFTADGRLPAPKLRAMFQRLRDLGPAEVLCPPSRPGALTEMTCFSPSPCIKRFVYYKTGEDGEIKPAHSPFLKCPTSPWQQLYRFYGGRNCSMKLEIKPHYRKGDSGCEQLPGCLTVCYKKDIMVCETEALTNSTVNIIPTEHWLHAMDTNTYPHPRTRHVRPLCKDETCANYYQSRRNYYICSDWTATDNILRLSRFS